MSTTLILHIIKYVRCILFLRMGSEKEDKVESEDVSVSVKEGEPKIDSKTDGTKEDAVEETEFEQATESEKVVEGVTNDNLFTSNSCNSEETGLDSPEEAGQSSGLPPRYKNRSLFLSNKPECKGLKLLGMHVKMSKT